MNDPNADSVPDVERCEPCQNLGIENAAGHVTGVDFTPTCGFHATHSWAQRPPASGIPEPPDQEQLHWFNEGLRRGWIAWFSICSGHQGEEDGCPRCQIGSYGLTMQMGSWQKRGAQIDSSAP